MKPAEITSNPQVFNFGGGQAPQKLSNAGSLPKPADVTGIKIVPPDPLHIDDFRAILYGYELHIVTEKGKLLHAVPLQELPSAPGPIAADAPRICKLDGDFMLELHEMGEAQVLAEPLEIAIVLTVRPSQKKATKTKQEPEPTDAQASEAQPTEAQPTDAQASEAQPTEAQPTEEQPTD